MWKTDKINGYEFFAKCYEIGSEFGIDEGRISKLSIRKGGKEIYNFDRGLDFDRLDAEGKKVFAEILKRYN